MNSDKLYYYASSADKPPGRGANEYVELSQIPSWR